MCRIVGQRDMGNVQALGIAHYCAIISESIVEG